MPKPETVVYMDHSEVREGKLGELKSAINDLIELVKAEEPRIIAYRVYFTDDGKRMTVIHIHPDSDSLEFHMQKAGRAFSRFADFIRMLKIDVYGKVSEGLLEQLRKKALILGGGIVAGHALHGGFARFEVR